MDYYELKKKKEGATSSDPEYTYYLIGKIKISDDTDIRT